MGLFSPIDRLWMSYQFRALNRKLDKIMSAEDDLRAAVADLKDSAAEAVQELKDDGAKIDDLTAKLAAMPAPASGTSDAAVEDVVAQIKAITAGLPKKVQPIVDTPVAPAA